MLPTSKSLKKHVFRKILVPGTIEFSRISRNIFSLSVTRTFTFVGVVNEVLVVVADCPGGDVLALFFLYSDSS